MEEKTEVRTINLTPQPAELFRIFDRMLSGIIVELHDGSITRARKQAMIRQLEGIRSEIQKYPHVLEGVTWEQFSNLGKTAGEDV